MLGALAMLSPSAAVAAERCAPRPTVTVAISPFDLAYPPNKPERLYPQAARQAGMSGHVTLECNAYSGRLDQCAIDEETPSDQGFGASALKVAKTLEVRTGPVAQIVRVEFQFDVQPPDGTCKGRS
ncbi:MAG TPA: energy transducer TonB [Caulobacteraceae bacterium]|nr:energy transducer TonB [Caulobacteraceae bacterium]